MRGWLRNDDLNNGKLYRSCRVAAKALACNKDTVTRSGFLGSDGCGVAAHYRFTDLAHGTHPPTREFEKWDGSLFVYTRHRPSRKKQNPVRSGRTPRPTSSDIRTVSDEGALCPVPSDIGEAPRCPARSDISRLPSPARGEGSLQGSLTVRAPAQAGGAGSSPAPVTKMVLEMVTK